MKTDPPALPGRLRLAVAIATVGRAETVAQALGVLRDQTRSPDTIIVCCPSASDVTGLVAVTTDVQVILEPAGLSRQRNRILKSLIGFDIVVYFDDDFVPDARYLEIVERVFISHPEVVMTTGRVLADGVRGPGLSLATAREILCTHAGDTGDPLRIQDVHNGYGCNMGIRLAPAFANELLFDEELPLYAWLEDIDFSRRLARHGRIVQVASAMGVHLGVKAGRQPGVRLGYSQIANPIYLVRKGTCSLPRALWLMSRNIAANVVRSTRPEPYVDRAGRALGNGCALLDLIRGQLTPTRIVSL